MFPLLDRPRPPNCCVWVGDLHVRTHGMTISDAAVYRLPPTLGSCGPQSMGSPREPVHTSPLGSEVVRAVRPRRPPRRIASGGRCPRVEVGAPGTRTGNSTTSVRHSPTRLGAGRPRQ